MNFSQAIEIIEKSQDDITDKVLLGEDPYPPDEYFLAVGKILPYLKCLDCMAKQAVNDNGRGFIPRCNADSFISPELNPEDLPFG